MSAAGWIKPTGTGTPAHVLLSKGASTNQNYWFGIRNNQFAVVYNDGSYTLVEAPGTLAQDTWHHLAYTYAANANLNMYVNGSLCTRKLQAAL